MYRIIKASSQPDGYWYLFRHGSGPGTIPKDVTLLDTCDHPTNKWKFYGKLDRFLTTKELQEYDLKEEMPPVECRSSVIKAETDNRWAPKKPNADDEDNGSRDATGTEYVIMVSDKRNHVIGFVRNLSRSRHINTLYVDVDENNAKVYDSAAKAKSAANMFSQFDEIYQYDDKDFLGSYHVQAGKDHDNVHFIDGAKVEVVSKEEE